MIAISPLGHRESITRTACSLQDIAACPDPLGANTKLLHGCEPMLYLCMCSVSYVRRAYRREKQESNLQGLRSTVFKTGAVVTSASSPNDGGRKRSRTSTACAARFPRGCRRPSAGPSRLVEAVGFEPTTARSQSEGSAWLSYTSTAQTCKRAT